MRTTLDLDDRLIKRAKELALRSNRTLTSVVEEGVRLSPPRSNRTLPSGVEEGWRLALSRPEAPPSPLPKGRLRFPPGVDLSNNAATLDWLESEDAPDG